MKDNNKKVLLGVIVVATLIIAIMGATFAFFSASGGSANNAVTANATTLSNLGFVSSHSKIATNLVPVSSESPYFSRYPGIAASGEHSCLDDLGNQICSIYEFIVTNTASVAQTIYVSFVPSENTFDNMYFAAFNTSIASANYVVATGSTGSGNNFTLIPQTAASNATLGHPATKLTQNSTSPISMSGLSTNLGTGESVTYTILVWLQETGTTQNTEQGGIFKAGVNVTTGSNATGVTGVLDGSSGGNYVYTVSSVERLNIGDAIPNNMVTYSTASSAMNGWITEKGYGEAKPYFLRYSLTNGVISEIYVGFEVTPSIASVNPGMTTGIYYLKGADGGVAYSDNVDVLLSAFGSSYCYSDDHVCDCDATDLSVMANDNGYVENIYDALGCEIHYDGAVCGYFD